MVGLLIVGLLNPPGRQRPSLHRNPIPPVPKGKSHRREKCGPARDERDAAEQGARHRRLQDAAGGEDAGHLKKDRLLKDKIESVRLECRGLTAENVRLKGKMTKLMQSKNNYAKALRVSQEMDKKYW